MRNSARNGAARRILSPRQERVALLLATGKTIEAAAQETYAERRIMPTALRERFI